MAQQVRDRLDVHTGFEPGHGHAVPQRMYPDVLDLSRENHREYYACYANGTLWPLCHYRTELVDYDRQYSVGYRRVNRIFAKAVIPLLSDDDVTDLLA